MWSFRVVPDEPVRQLPIELFRILKEREIPVNEFLLDRPIESFAVGVHLRGLGIGMPMQDGLPVELGLKGFHELRAIVREHPLDLVRKRLKDGPEDVRRLL